MPKQVDREGRRAALADAAARVIADNGFDGARLRDVAAEAGWTTGALTHYFPDKHALLLAALEGSLERVRGRHRATALDRGEGLRLLLEQALPADEDRRRHWRVVLAFTVQSWNDDEMALVQRRTYRSWRRSIVTLIAEGIARGDYAPGVDPEEAADELIAVVDGVAMQALYDPERWPPERQERLLTGALRRLVEPSPLPQLADKHYYDYSNHSNHGNMGRAVRE